jgi:MFS family permease
MAKKKHYAWTILAACCVMGFVESGLLTNTNALFIPYYVEGVGISMTTYTMFLMVQTLLMAVAMPVAGKVIATGKLKIAVAVPAIIQVVSLVLRSQAQNLGVYVAAVILMGPANAFLMGMLTYTLMANWFEKGLGTVTGVMAAIGGIGGVIMNPVAGQLIENIGWRNTQLIYAGIVAVTLLPLALFVLKFAPGAKEGPYGADPNKKKGEKGEAELVGPSFKVVSKSSPFWLLLVVGALLPVVLGLQQMISPHLTGKGMSVTEIAYVMSAVMVGTTIAQPLTGILLDKVNQTVVILTLSVLGAFGWVGMVFGSGGVLIAASGVAIGIGAAFMAVVVPVIRRRDYGLKAYTQANAMSGLFSALIPAISLIIVGLLADQTKSYQAAFLAPVVLYAVCVVCSIVSSKKRYDIAGTKLNLAYQAELNESRREITQ